MSLKRKELEILRLVIDGKTFVEILSKLDTSERNLRYMLQNLNFYLRKILNKVIEKDKEKLLISLDEREINSFFSTVYKNYYILDNFERSEYIIMGFLYLKDMNLTTLESRLGITRATLKKDIEMVNFKLEKHGLRLDSEKNRFRIIGNEKKLRHLKALKYIEYTQEELGWLHKDYIFSDIDKKQLERLKELVLKIENQFSLTFDIEFVNLMIIFLYVTLERIKLGYIIDRKANYKFLINTEHYTIIESVLEAVISKDMSYEFVHLTEYFISGGVKDNISELKSSVEKYIEGLEEKCMAVISSTIEEFRFSEELKIKLMGYLIPAIYRLRNNFSIGKIGERGHLYETIFLYSTEEKFLPEKLTEFEIYYISCEIEKEIGQESQKVMKLSHLLNIIEKNSLEIDRENIIKELIDNYGKLIKIDIFD